MHWEYGDSGNEFVRLTVTGPAPGPELAWRLVQGEFLRKYGVHMAGRSWEDAAGARYYEVGFRYQEVVRGPVRAVRPGDGRSDGLA